MNLPLKKILHSSSHFLQNNNVSRCRQRRSWSWRVETKLEAKLESEDEWRRSWRVKTSEDEVGEWRRVKTKLKLKKEEVEGKNRCFYIISFLYNDYLWPNYYRWLESRFVKSLLNHKSENAISNDSFLTSYVKYELSNDESYCTTMIINITNVTRLVTLWRKTFTVANIIS